MVLLVLWNKEFDEDVMGISDIDRDQQSPTIYG